jgi:hypothetical protein
MKGRASCRTADRCFNWRFQEYGGDDETRTRDNNDAQPLRFIQSLPKNAAEPSTKMLIVKVSDRSYLSPSSYIGNTTPPFFGIAS